VLLLPNFQRSSPYFTTICRW